MEIKEIEDKKVWEDFLMSCEEKTFLDSWNWGEFQLKEGNRIWRLGVYDNNLIAVGMAVLVRAKRGVFLFVPHGPVGLNKEQILKAILSELKVIASKEKVGFVRICPIWERNKENNEIFDYLQFKNAPIHMHPEVTWELDISRSENDILSGMRKTTRYLIRQAEKNNEIKIIQSRDILDLDKFKSVYSETVKRHKFTAFSDNYLKNQFNSFNPDNQISIFLGTYKGEVVSSAIVVYWQGIGFYHHGASLSKYNKIPVSYLLQWEAIKEAKRRGCRSYNFWGIAPDIKEVGDASNSKHPWAGLSLFKMGFGGERKEYVKTKDYVISPTYYLTYLFELLRRIKRGL